MVRDGIHGGLSGWDLMFLLEKEDVMMAVQVHDKKQLCTGFR
jgi:hypothetical protein